MKNFLADVMLGLNSYKNLIQDINKKNTISSVNGIIEEGLGHFIYSVNFHAPGRKLIITYDISRANLIYEDLKNLGIEDVYLFPKKEDFFYSSLAKSLDSSNAQIEAMWGFLKKDAIVVTTVDAVLNKIMSKEEFSDKCFFIKNDDIIDIAEISNRLTESGYEKVYAVDGKGQFSVRGGIIDIFVPIADNPYRIELFGDEIDSMRTFDAISQRSIENIDMLEITPANEILISEDDKLNIADKLLKDIKSSKIQDEEIKNNLTEKFQNVIVRLKDNLFIRNLDIVSPYIDDEKLNSIVDYKDENTLIFIDEPKRLEERVDDLKKDFKSRFSDLLISGEALPSHENTFYNYEKIAETIKENNIVTFSNILRDNKYFKPTAIFNFHMKSTTSYNGRMDIFAEEIERYKYRGYKIAILSETKEKLKRIYDVLNELEINSTLLKDSDTEIKSGQVYLIDRSVRNGFEYTDLKLFISNTGEIYGNSSKKKINAKKKKKAGITDFADLKIGDYVVHDKYGVGIYQGTEALVVQNVKKDYILIQYQGADRLYIPTDQLGMIYKYSGVGDKKPKVNKLNSVEWKKTKLKAKQSIDDIAEELIELYAARNSQKGYKFSKDTIWQNQFEDAFPYQATDGQLKAIAEIKEDMESEKPMDRLLCADVGFGKTEVALRAAFKAVMDGKQVAFLVPTTILAQQHYNTMVERFRDFPVKVSILSRFRTRKEINEDIKNLEKGLIDIVVGTHRLLSKDVKFKDLGLLIIDEEQRFGVRHKETLKMLKKNVDTLTLTATPIPRTLQMSMLGIRDISIIENPPENRFPVQTYVAEFNPTMIREAILKEVDRSGQVYFVYNNVMNMDNMASKLQQLVPEVKISTANGQMPERILEDTFVSFLNKESDVLVCSTIIETGLDISNVNTIIVYDADKFGLAQLYQLRGRVGRTNKVAYAYLTYKKDKQISEISEKRLMAIKEFTEFGSGFKIAKRDLEIRGAGNILSSKQHGHIDSIGYDLYFSYLESAIRKRKGEDVKDINDTTIDINIEAFIPDTYIEDEAQRLEFYKKISLIESDDDYSDLIEEAIDRFGDIPESVNNLMDISHIKYIANKKNIESINGDVKRVRISFADKIDFDSANNILGIYGNRIYFDNKGKYVDFNLEKYPLLEIKDFVQNLN